MRLINILQELHLNFDIDSCLAKLLNMRQLVKMTNSFFTFFNYWKNAFFRTKASFYSAFLFDIQSLHFKMLCKALGTFLVFLRFSQALEESVKIAITNPYIHEKDIGKAILSNNANLEKHVSYPSQKVFIDALKEALEPLVLEIVPYPR